MAGTTNKSMAAMSGAWFRRKVRHPWLGGPHRLTMYLATVDLCNLKTELEQLGMDARGSPNRVLDAHLPDQNAKLAIDRRPPSPRSRLPAPVAAKTGPLPTNDRLRPNDGEDP